VNGWFLFPVAERGAYEGWNEVEALGFAPQQAKKQHGTARAKRSERERR
jgi:hypothetical protein